MDNSDMFLLAEEYNKLREDKKEIENKLKEVNCQIASIEKDLIQVMTSNECESFKMDGKNFVMVTKSYPCPVPNKKPQLYEAMTNQGFGHLFTINTNTFQSAIRELKESNNNTLPDWLEGLVKDNEIVSIQLRKF